jgi:hypothetical protein
MRNGGKATHDVLTERSDAQEVLDRLDEQIEELAEGIKLERMLHPAGWRRPV